MDRNLPFFIICLVFIILILIICNRLFKRFKFSFNPLNLHDFFHFEGESQSSKSHMELQTTSQRQFEKAQQGNYLNKIILNDKSLNFVLMESTKEVKKISEDFQITSICLYYHPYIKIPNTSPSTIQISFHSKWLKRDVNVYCKKDNLSIDPGVQISYAGNELLIHEEFTGKFWEKFPNWKIAYKKALEKTSNLSEDTDSSHRIYYSYFDNKSLNIIFEDGRTKDQFRYKYSFEGKLISTWDNQEIEIDNQT